MSERTHNARASSGNSAKRAFVYAPPVSYLYAERGAHNCYYCFMVSLTIEPARKRVDDNAAYAPRDLRRARAFFRLSLLRSSRVLFARALHCAFVSRTPLYKCVLIFFSPLESENKRCGRAAALGVRKRCRKSVKISEKNKKFFRLPQRRKSLFNLRIVHQ